jgi:hypothetical protein
VCSAEQADQVHFAGLTVSLGLTVGVAISSAAVHVFCAGLAAAAHESSPLSVILSPPLTLSVRLFEAELQKQQEELRAQRMSQVSTGSRVH